jgi:hypothetical protein
MNPSRPTGGGAGSESRVKSDFPETTHRTSAPLQPSLGEEMSQTAKAVQGEAGTVAASLTGDLKDAAKTTKRAVQQQASEFMGQVGHELTKTAEEQKVHGVEAIEGFAHAINTAAAELERQSPRVAQYVRDAANKIEELSGNIRSRNVNELLHAATDLARSHPALFFGGAVAAGFALSRFLKSSAQHTSSSQSNPSNASAGLQATRSGSSASARW